MRTGIIAKKIGMTQLYKEGAHITVTVLSLENCQVAGLRQKDKDGYSAVILGAGTRKIQRTNEPLKGFYAKIAMEPKQKLAEFRVSDDAMLEVGQTLSAAHYVEGQLVDITGVSIGKGFQGSMKRHNFGGGRASHGNSVSHRAHGSTGNRQDPGRVFKNKKMAGHMGARRVTTQNLKIAGIDEARGLVFVMGAVPGSDNAFVLVKDAVKKARPEGAPYPAAIKIA